MNNLNAVDAALILNQYPWCFQRTPILLCALLAGAAYIGLGFMAWRRNTKRDKHAEQTHQLHTRTVPAWQNTALILTATLHVLVLLFTMWQPKGAVSAVYLGYAQALSLAACVGVVLFIIESRWVDIDSLRPLALSLPALMVVLGAYLPASMQLKLDGLGVLHVLVGIAAHGVALLGAGHALLLLALTHVLRNRSVPWAQALTQHCPPLVVLERLLIRQSLWVAALLSATILLGVLDGIVRFDHKTVLTAASLCAWLGVAYGYQSRGWRGIMLCCAVWCATALLLLAYIGSRFVLQVLLHR